MHNRAAVTLTLAASLALATPLAASASTRAFAKNSLLIPASMEYQTDNGVISAYGLVYSILHLNKQRIADDLRPITVYWVIEPRKRSHHRCWVIDDTLPSYDTYNDYDGCDLAIQKSDGQPVTRLRADNVSAEFDFPATKITYTKSSGIVTRGSATFPIDEDKYVVKYLGGVWVIDATDREAFLAALNAAPLNVFRNETTYADHFVQIHSAEVNFTAPVARVMRDKPPTVAMLKTGGALTFLENYMALAGLDHIDDGGGPPYAGVPGASGVIYDVLQAAHLTLSGVGLNERITVNGVQVPKYELFWATDNMGLTPAQKDAITAFVRDGGSMFAQADFIDVVENAGSYHTSAGIESKTSTLDVPDDCTDRLVVPATGVFHSERTGDCAYYHPGPLGQAFAQTGNYHYESGQANFKAYRPKGSASSAYYNDTSVLLEYPCTGVNACPVATAWQFATLRHMDGDASMGLIAYLAGHKYDQVQRYWGLRVVLNTVLDIAGTNPLELARSEPVGYKNVSASPVTSRVYQGTYEQLPVNDALSTYNPSLPWKWRFPYTKGHLYEYDSGAVPEVGEGFASTKNWDAADKMLAPGSRTLFTVLGGSAHLGWKKVEFKHTQVSDAACTDANADSKCDLAQALAACPTAGVDSTMLELKTAGSRPNAKKLGLFVQQARGFCSAHSPRAKATGEPIMEPALAECDSIRQDNLASLGGVDHGSAAVIGPSRYVKDKDPVDATIDYTKRPVVAFAGARDGMLHAFYVSGGAGFTGMPAGVVAGQELWGFLPPGQLCGLQNNSAAVDASVNVIDVFGDFPRDANADGVIDWTNASERPDGLREWRTVLLAAAGPAGSELFALDVTNPLKPILLWHVGGQTEKDGRYDRNRDGDFADAADVKADDDPATWALTWFDWEDGDAITTHIPSDYNESDAADLAKLRTGRYDYRNMGPAYGTSVGKLWDGIGYRYVAFVTAATADYTDAIKPTGYRGIEVFAIDLLSGKKLWQWQRRYVVKDPVGTVIATNDIPGRPALADSDADGSVERVYVGDMEGRMWELSAVDGRNLNYLEKQTGGFVSLPLFGTPRMVAAAAATATKDLYRVGATDLARQPLTSPIGLGRFTDARDDLKPYLQGRLAVVQGTMGVDWSIAPFERGNVFVIPVAPEAGTRVTAPVDLVAKPELLETGVLLPAAVWQIPLLQSERVYGMPRVVNNHVVFNTASGSFGGDISETLDDQGRLLIIGKGPTPVHEEQNDAKAFGGVLVFDGRIIVTTATSISQVGSDATVGVGTTQERPFNRFTPAVLRSFEPQPDAHPPYAE